MFNSSLRTEGGLAIIGPNQNFQFSRKPNNDHEVQHFQSHEIICF